MFHSIQALRALAAILVVIHHYQAPFEYLAVNGFNDPLTVTSWGKLNIFGAVGVPIFFVISGFVMGLQPETSGWMGVWVFFSRRLLRIVPLYWVITVLAALYIGPFDFGHVFRSLTFTSGGGPFILPGWTLEYEMMFYLGFAAVVASGVIGSSTRGIGALVCLMVILAAANVFGFAFAQIGYPIILEFCGGLIVSRVYRHADIAAIWPLYLCVAGALFYLSIAPSAYSMPMIDLHWGVGAFFLVLGLVCAETHGYIFGKGRVWGLLGDASYSIYLVHMPFSAVAFGLLFWRWPALQTLAVPDFSLGYIVACGVVAGVAVHLFIEKPITSGLKWLLSFSCRASY